MANPLDGSRYSLGLGQEPRSTKSRLALIIAAVISLIWIIAVLFYSKASAFSLGLGPILFALLVPLALIWVSALSLRRIEDLRAQTLSLQAALNSTQANLAQAQSAAARAALNRADEPVSPKLGPAIPAVGPAAEPAAAQPMPQNTGPRPEPKLSATPKPAAPPSQSVTEDQSHFGFDGPSMPQEPLSVADFVRATQFPESADDEEGIYALRLALEDREVAKLIRAAQDVLTLLSQEGVYMDDLPPERCHPDLWRRFAHGERGHAITAVGGIRDRASLAITSGRMREDTIFRDAAHHFLRTFDKVYQSVEPRATDSELIAMSDTRTTRAFMLLGRVAGVFD